MNHNNPTWRRTRVVTMAFLVTVALTLSFAPLASAHGGNHGTVKVHDNETADPDVRNEPHVSCDFWIEGFKMHDSGGELVFYGWPPTGNKSVVIPSGNLTWSGTGGAEEGYHFLAGPYRLPAGHYRVEAFSNGGHPGDHDHFSKSKTFWVDECADIPVFPTLLASSLAVGLGAAGYAALRRR